MPFTIEKFLAVFKAYNQEVWPMQVVFFLMAVFVIFLGVRKTPYSAKIIMLSLAFLWLWMGIVYHWMFFTSINKMAWLFGAFFLIQGGIFAKIGLMPKSFSFQFRPDVYGITGAVLMAFSLVIYPISGLFFGHIYPNSPTFGLPCPTTIFTFGILLWCVPRFSFSVILIPLLWSAIGFSAALLLGIYEDTALLISGVATLFLMIGRNRNLQKITS